MEPLNYSDYSVAWGKYVYVYVMQLVFWWAWGQFSQLTFPNVECPLNCKNGQWKKKWNVRVGFVYGV
jgi:hypothetical protein